VPIDYVGQAQRAASRRPCGALGATRRDASIDVATPLATAALSERARRWDLASADGQTAGGPLPATVVAVDLRYAYDAGDTRVLKTSADTTAGAAFDDAARAGSHTVYVFDSVELRGAGWVCGGETADYELSMRTEVPYLTVGGARIGRVHYETDAVPASSFVQAHVYLELPDHLGSTSIVIDRETGELVEAGTYTAQGTKESDYRPERWKSFREDYGFTGKEEDVEVGLTYFGKRFLNPYLGRWMSPDPLALHAPGEGDLNLYAYVHGRLLSAVDPVGLNDTGCGNSHASPQENAPLSSEFPSTDIGYLRRFAEPGGGATAPAPKFPSLAEQGAGRSLADSGLRARTAVMPLPRRRGSSPVWSLPLTTHHRVVRNCW
jgi:RHS repeat-associated protein